MADVVMNAPSITLEAAVRAIEAAQVKAREIGVPMAIAVVDGGGNLKAAVRMDGAALLGMQVATDKAYTAVGFGMPTRAWPEHFGEDKPLWDNIHAIRRAVPFAGGIPIQVAGAIVGAIGVSGGHYSQDEQVAAAGAAALSA